MMTREEAINWLEAYLADYYDAMDIPDDLPYEVAHCPLRPPPRQPGEGGAVVWWAVGRLGGWLRRRRTGLRYVDMQRMAM